MSEQQQQVVLRTKQVINDFKISRSFIWREEKAGRFPKKVKLGRRAVGWLKSDLDAWLQGLKEKGAQNGDQVGQ